MYVWCGFLGCIIRSMDKKNYLPQNFYQYVGHEIAFQLLNLLLLVLLDWSDWIFTPDWVVYFLQHLFLCEVRDGTFSKKRHRNVRPLNIFGKPEGLPPPEPKAPKPPKV